MSTNYYLRGAAACAHCGRGADLGRHIGKSSSGWAFGLRIYPDEGIASLDDWRPLFERHGVVDEYGDPVDDIVAIITERGDGLRRHCEMAGLWPGRVQLLEGVTYDLIELEFQ